MKHKLLYLLAVLAIIVGGCQDDLSEIGPSIASNNGAIEVDSLFTIKGSSEYAPVFDSRTTDNLLGRISVPEYGDLRCTYVAQLLSAAQLPVLDDVPVEKIDSVKMFISAVRGTVTGDSLAPQQLKVFRLTKSLPKDIDNTFDPTGYYDAENPIGTRNYTLTQLGNNDSIFKYARTIDIQVKLPDEYGRAIYDAYRNTPEVFQWPASFVEKFPGIYVEPTFGRGCIANIANTRVVLYWNHTTQVTQLIDGESVTKDKIVKDSVTVFSTAPEVLSSNNVKLEVSQYIKDLVSNGSNVILAPSGYNIRMTVPLDNVIKRCFKGDVALRIINNLTYSIPAQAIKNDYGIAVPPYLLMVRTSKMKEFFETNSLPDGKGSFWGAYNGSTGTYDFTTMREYLLELINKEGVVTYDSNKNVNVKVDEEDMDFTLVPVYITTETQNDATIVTGCTPYVVRPTMCILDIEHSKLKLTYSTQQLN